MGLYNKAEGTARMHPARIKDSNSISTLAPLNSFKSAKSTSQGSWPSAAFTFVTRKEKVPFALVEI